MVALALLLAAGAVGAQQIAHDPRLSATLVGSLDPGATGRIAVRWDGEPGALLDAWVDLDGNGRRSPRELVVDGRPLAGGIEVVEFGVDADALVAAEPRLWVEAREQGSARPAGDESREACGWQPGFFLSDLDGTAWAMTVFDDGTGPALYVGGEFLSAGGVLVNHIARWDGTAWSALSGPSGTGVDSSVYALAVFDDGSGPALYAGGEFKTAGGLTVNCVAHWDGTTWYPLSGPSGTGVSAISHPAIYALTVLDEGTGPALFAGGAFSSAGGLTANGIARWDGNAWSRLQDGYGVESGCVYALAVFDDGSGPALYAGGSFAEVGGELVNHIARWDGTAWSRLQGPSGTGVSGSFVRALTVFDDSSGPALYAGGLFTTAGGVTVSNVARWDGSAWSALSGPSGTGVDSYVYALAVFDDGTGSALYAGGSFATAGGVTVKRVARWDGTAWSGFSGPSGAGADSYVYALTVFDAESGPALFAGGAFTFVDGMTVNKVARWDGTAWSALGGTVGMGVNKNIYALAVFDDGSGSALYAGGAFVTAGGVWVSRIARWDGTSWSALSGPSGTGSDYTVSALTVFDDGSGPALYVGGWFTTAGGVTVNGVARWDGTLWSALSGPSGTGVEYCSVTALTVFDDGAGPALYAGGGFTTAGGVTANGVARWDGTSWSPLSGPSGTGVSGYINALSVFDDGSGPALYAGGLFTAAGGVTANNVARWDGSAWTALSGPSGTGTDGGVSALAAHNDGSGPALYAGGTFTTAGGVTVNNIARWDGTAWSALSSPSGVGLNAIVNALTIFDDGSGLALYAGGGFTDAGGLTVNRVARWGGSSWSPLNGPSGTGVDYVVYALTAFDDGAGPALYAGGCFTVAGGLASYRIAAWRGPCASLFADGFETGDTTLWSLTVP